MIAFIIIVAIISSVVLALLFTDYISDHKINPNVVKKYVRTNRKINTEPDKSTQRLNELIKEVTKSAGITPRYRGQYDFNCNDYQVGDIVTYKGEKRIWDGTAWLAL